MQTQPQTHLSRRYFRLKLSFSVLSAASTRTACSTQGGTSRLGAQRQVDGEQYLPWNHHRGARGCQTPLLTSSFWALHAHQEKHVWLLPAPHPYSQPEVPAWDVQGLSRYIETHPYSLQPVTRFSPSACPFHQHTGKAFGSHNQCRSISSEITKRPSLPEVMIKRSCPSNTTPLHKSLLALLGGRRRHQEYFFSLMNSNIKPDVNLAYSLIPNGTFSWNMKDTGSCTIM